MKYEFKFAHAQFFEQVISFVCLEKENVHDPLIVFLSKIGKSFLHVIYPNKVRVRGPLACFSLSESGDYITLHYMCMYITQTSSGKS